VDERRKWGGNANTGQEIAMVTISKATGPENAKGSDNGLKGENIRKNEICDLSEILEMQGEEGKKEKTKSRGRESRALHRTLM